MTDSDYWIMSYWLFDLLDSINCHLDDREAGLNGQRPAIDINAAQLIHFALNKELKNV